MHAGLAHRKPTHVDRGDRVTCPGLDRPGRVVEQRWADDADNTIDELIQQRELGPSAPQGTGSDGDASTDDASSASDILLPGFHEDLYPLSDLHYRTAALSHQSGAIVEAYDYDPYGFTRIYSGCGDDLTWFTDDDKQWRSPAGPDVRGGGTSGAGGGLLLQPLCSHLYTGRYYDAETGLYDYRQRMYHPGLGRFLQPDPIGYAGGTNLYEYVGGQPNEATDPHGEFIWFIPLLVLAAGVGGVGYYSASAEISSRRYGGPGGGALDALGGAGYGARGGSSIVFNTYSFGFTDWVGLTDSEQYHGWDFTASRVFATISREVAITAATLGMAQIGRGGVAASQRLVPSLINSAANSPRMLLAARRGSAALAAIDVGTGAYQAGGAAVGIWDDPTNPWAYLDLGLGILSVAGGLYGARERSIWRNPSQTGRGKAGHVIAGENLRRNHPVIDRRFFGNAQSIKTYDLRAWDAATIRRNIRRDLLKLYGAPAGMLGNDVAGRTLKAVLPHGSAQIHGALLNDLQREASEIGILLLFREIY